MPTSLRTTPSARFADVYDAPPSVAWDDDHDRITRSSVCGIVLAGSHGWGDGPFERLLRGPLLPVAQAPLICYALEWLRDAGIPTSVICANSNTGAVRDCLGDGSQLGLTLDYVEDVEPRGPAGCAHDAARRSAANAFVVVEGTLIPSLDLGAVLATHRAARAAATVVVEVERRRKAIASVPPRAPGGIYVFDRRVLEQVADRGFQDIKQGLLPQLYESGVRVAVHEVAGIAPRVLDYATYVSASQWLIARSVERPGMLGDYERVDDGRRHPTARVHRSARLIGPVLLGPHACVNERAVIVGPAAVGAGSVIGAGALVARSLIWDGCTVGELAIVDGALLTSHVMVPARAVVSGGTHVAHDAPAASPPSPARSRIVEPPAGAKSHDRPARPPVKPPSGYVRPLGRRGGDPQATGERPSGP